MNEYNYIEEEQGNMLACEPSSWGGQWTEEKLDAFEKYVNAYLTIMNPNREKYHWKLIYFDGFAGSGSRNDDSSQAVSELMLDLFKDEYIDEEELNTYKGAAERILGIKQKKPIEKIAELYIEQLNSIFDHVTEKPLVLYNSRKTPIFHFACASNNSTAIKIASQIINKKQSK